MNCQQNNHAPLPESPSLLTREWLQFTVSGIKLGLTDSEINMFSLPNGMVLGNRCRQGRQCIPPSHLPDVLHLSTFSVFVYCVLIVTLLVFPQMFGHPLISTSSTTYVWILPTKWKKRLDSGWKETAIRKTQTHRNTHTDDKTVFRTPWEWDGKMGKHEYWGAEIQWGSFSSSHIINKYLAGV